MGQVGRFPTASGNHGELILFLSFSQKKARVVNYTPDLQVKEKQLYAAGTKHEPFTFRQFRNRQIQFFEANTFSFFN